LSKQKVTRVDLTKSLSELKLKDILTNQPWGLICDDGFRAMFKEWGISDSKLISADDVMEDPDEVLLPKVAVVCTEKPERLIQIELRERDDIQTLGLFSQLIPRLAAGLPPRWKPRSDLSVKLEYAIVCLPRCGSTLVSRELNTSAARFRFCCASAPSPDLISRVGGQWFARATTSMVYSPPRSFSTS
jgi:hypothetical protein